MSFAKRKRKYKGLTLRQLAERREALIAAAGPGEGVWLYDKKTRRELEILAWCVFDKLKEKK